MGMPKIELRLQMFRGDWDQIWSQQRLLWIMEGLCRVNQTHLRQFDAFVKRGLVQKSYPSVYRAGLHYETEKGTEIWPDIPSLITGTMGEGLYPGPWGDCEDLACYRVAEWRQLPWHYARPFDRKRAVEGLVSGDIANVECADPRFPQTEAEMKAAKAGKDWPGWKKVKGGVKAKPFAKWRRGPKGNYHYHALVLVPWGRLEDPSLVLGMGKEKAFAEAGLAVAMKNPETPVIIQYAKPPEVMVVDPEKPSGYSGGKAVVLDKKITDMLKKGEAPPGVDVSLGDPRDPEYGVYMPGSNEFDLNLGDGEFDVDAIIGWSRAEKRFTPKSASHELRRLLGYAKH